MRKSKSNHPRVTVFERPTFEQRDPESLKREISTNAQKDQQSGTIIYGADNALPLRIAQAIDESPAASSCIDTTAQFIKGSGFSNKDAQKIKLDKSGTTLWDLHCALADSLALFWGFSVNLKFNKYGKILFAYQMSFESCRLKKPEGDTPDIAEIVYNPYVGTTEYKSHMDKTYPVYDIKEVGNQISEMGKAYPGQVYYYGKTSPLYRFYPVPKYWTGKGWIKIDGRIQEAHSENLENGWFQSVLMNVIGDPNKASANPKYQSEYTDEAGVKRIKSSKTVGEEFNEQMATAFSGSKKMGTVQVHWSNNENTATKITAFPTNANADLFLALQDLTTKNITIATRVPSILANISEGVSLGSGGSEMQKAVELMQSRTSEWRMKLETFYNEVLLPNLAEGAITEPIQILNFTPISEPIDIEDKFWDALNEESRLKFIEKNFPNIEIVRPVVTPVIDPAAPVVPPGTVLPDGTVQPEPPPAPNESMREWSMSELNKIQKIVSRYNLSLSDPTNGKALTFEQAKQILMSYGLTDADINAWIIKPEEL